MKSTWSLSVAVILTLACGIATAQSQNESLGDYARAVRKAKPESGTDAPKVYDNDNLSTQGTVSVVGSQSGESDDSKGQDQSADKTQDQSSDKTQSASDSDASKTDANTDSDANKTDANANSTDSSRSNAKKDEPTLKPGQSDADRDKALDALKTKLAAQRDKVSLLTRELDVLKGEYNLKATEFYNNAVRRAQNGTSGLMPDDATYKQKIADKQKALDEANAELTDMQDKARSQGAPPSALE